MADEDRKERIDRELIELLNELRVALPGVQVLFAFLLVLPFQQRFTETTDLVRMVYFAGLVTSAVATAFLIAPATYHRVNLRRGTDEKEEMLFTSSRFALIGSAFLATGVACSIFVVGYMLFGELPAAIVAALIGVGFALLWYVYPLTRRHNGNGGDHT